jgi:hypothetical protein
VGLILMIKISSIASFPLFHKTLGHQKGVSVRCSIICSIINKIKPLKDK